ncbi:MobH family relaxase [Thiohalocapsa marina]|uniref:MobH family relaxase n=1 Tax=Thiohalocapsa marina TaxID=424902 RepID=UPI001FEBFE00|nr:MobH family relaxase [Thiohalocapsa marina]
MHLLRRLRSLAIPAPTGQVAPAPMPTPGPTPMPTPGPPQVPGLVPVPTSPPPSPAAPDEPIPRYPPRPPGLPLPPLEQLVATQQTLIARLRRELTLGNDEDGTDRWAAYVAPVIQRYAACVHLIPASASAHHHAAGGLYRHGLEAAFHAARASRAVMVGLDRPRAEQRRLEPRLRTAAALGGLLQAAGTVFHAVVITDPEARSTWSPVTEDLNDWAAREGIARYVVRWRLPGPQVERDGQQLFNLIALKRILTTDVERWLYDPDPDIYNGFIAAVTGVPYDSVLVELVRQARLHSIEQDLRAHHGQPGDEPPPRQPVVTATDEGAGQVSTAPNNVADIGSEPGSERCTDSGPVSAAPAPDAEPEPEPDPEHQQPSTPARPPHSAPRRPAKQPPPATPPRTDSAARLLALLRTRTAPTAAPPSEADHLTWRDGLLWLRYPQWFTAAGWDPAEAAQALSADGLIEPDPKTPMRRVREYDGQRWLVLTAELSAQAHGQLPKTLTPKANQATPAAAS